MPWPRSPGHAAVEVHKTWVSTGIASAGSPRSYPWHTRIVASTFRVGETPCYNGAGRQSGDVEVGRGWLRNLDGVVRPRSPGRRLVRLPKGCFPRHTSPEPVAIDLPFEDGNPAGSRSGLVWLPGAGPWLCRPGAWPRNACPARATGVLGDPLPFLRPAGWPISAGSGSPAEAARCGAAVVPAPPRVGRGERPRTGARAVRGRAVEPRVLGSDPGEPSGLEQQELSARRRPSDRPRQRQHAAR